MAKGLKNNSFLEGAAFAYIAILGAKILGAVYSIPFYSIIGDHGGVIYSCAYNIYSLFLDISTSGIPIAVSIVISEFNTKGMIRSKQRTYTLTLRFITAVSLLCFLIMQIFAKGIGMYFLDDMTSGVTPQEIATAVRTVSFCLLVVPFLSLKRGYLQGHKIMKEPSASQVIEQLVRIVFVLVMSFLIIKIMKKDTVYGVCAALFGATVGAAVAYFYLSSKERSSRRIFRSGADPDEIPASDTEIAKRIFSYCLTIVIVAVSASVYSIVDMKMILTGLHRIGYSDIDTQEIASISSTWIPKVCMIITALSMGITNSICPHLAEKRTDGKMDGVNKTLNQALSAFLLISVPLAIALNMLAKPIYNLFYGESEYGAGILCLAAIVNVVGSMATVVGVSMQSIGKGKTVCIYNLIGIIVNASLDLPLIYLMENINGKGYLGATVSSILGQSFTLILLLISLKRSFGFSFKPVIGQLLRLTPATGILALTVAWLLTLRPIMYHGRLSLLLQLFAFAVCGSIPYFSAVLATGGVSAVVGKGEIKKLIIKVKNKIGG